MKTKRKSTQAVVSELITCMQEVARAVNQLIEEEHKALQAMMLPTCYISGAITHFDQDKRKAAFAKAAADLRQAGYTPVNPFNNGVTAAAHWSEHMRADIGLLVRCDYIYMLKGWEQSKGAKLELDVASSCGIKILFEPQLI